MKKDFKYGINRAYYISLKSFWKNNLEGSNRILASPAQDDEGEHRQPVEDPGREREEVYKPDT